MATSVGTLLLDQAAKAVLTATVPPGVSLEVVPRILALTHVRNTGIAFGLFRDLPPLVMVVGALTVVFLLFYNQVRASGSGGHVRPGRLGGQVRPGRSGGHVRPGGRARRLDLAAAGLIVGGALGNVIDRVRLGYVIDYLDLHVWPVFNLADAAVVCGAGLLLVEALRGSRGPETEPVDATAARGDP